MYSIIPTLTENAIAFDMKKRVCGVVVVVFLPFSLKTEKESMQLWLLKGVLVVLSRRPKEEKLSSFSS